MDKIHIYVLRIIDGFCHSKFGDFLECDAFHLVEFREDLIEVPCDKLPLSIGVGGYVYFIDSRFFSPPENLIDQCLLTFVPFPRCIW